MPRLLTLHKATYQSLYKPMNKTLLFALITASALLTACAHPNPRGALDEMVGTVGGAYRNISTAPNPWGWGLYFYQKEGKSL